MSHWYGILFTGYVFECHCLSYHYVQTLPYFVILDNNNDDDDDYDNDNEINNDDNEYTHNNDANSDTNKQRVLMHRHQG